MIDNPMIYVLSFILIKVTIVVYIFKSFVLDVAQWQVEWKQKYHERI